MYLTKMDTMIGFNVIFDSHKVFPYISAETVSPNRLQVDTIDVLECEELAGRAIATSAVVAVNAAVDKVSEKFPAGDGHLENSGHSLLRLRFTTPAL
jgi:hypothetical protein